jgi:hypothetical protein
MARTETRALDDGIFNKLVETASSDVPTHLRNMLHSTFERNFASVGILSRSEGSFAFSPFRLACGFLCPKELGLSSSGEQHVFDNHWYTIEMPIS